MQSTTTKQPELFEPKRDPAAGFDEARLIEKLRAIESLFSGATTSGERDAADAARQRIRERLRALINEDEPEEYQFSMSDLWSRKVFVALLRRYGVRPYRYRRQRHTTVMACVPKRFLDETLWPEFQKLSAMLKTYLSGVTDRVVTQVLCGDSSDADVVAEPPRLGPTPGAETTQEPVAASQRTESPASGHVAPNKRAGNKRRKRGKKRKKRRRR